MHKSLKILLNLHQIRNRVLGKPLKKQENES